VNRIAVAHSQGQNIVIRTQNNFLLDFHTTGSLLGWGEILKVIQGQTTSGCWNSCDVKINNLKSFFMKIQAFFSIWLKGAWCVKCMCVKGALSLEAHSGLKEMVA
jgi:hypothetical protein